MHNLPRIKTPYDEPRKLIFALCVAPVYDQRVRCQSGQGGVAIATPHIEAVIDRLSADQAFRVKYCQDPDGTLAAYHLSTEEIQAIKTGDDRLQQLIGENKWDELIQALCGPHPGP
jgi:hypothetical protein